MSDIAKCQASYVLPNLGIDTEIFKLFAACDFDFDPMTLACERDLVMVVTYLHAKNKVSRSKGSKVIVCKHRQTCAKPLPARSRGR